MNLTVARGMPSRPKHGVIEMSTQLIALLMFLPLTCLLFRRPSSAATGRYPTELNIWVRHSLHLKSELPMERAASSRNRSGMNRAFLQSSALGLAPVLPSGAVAMTQTPAGAQVQLAAAGNDSKTVKEDRKEGRAANDRVKTDKDNAELLEEMRQLIERLEARINRLEAEKGAAVKPALPARETQDANVAAPSATPTPEQTSALSEGATWLVTDKLTLAAEADYVINRVQEFSPPSRVTGGAAYARYQFTPKFAMAGRADRGGLFSGVTQALKETTLTADYKLAEGFLMRGEWRRDFSDRPFFLLLIALRRKISERRTK
jgi:hypothetical protein